MTGRRALLLAWFAAMAAVRPLPSAEPGSRQSFQVTSTEKIPFPPEGMVRLDNSYGYLTVEGWDEPAVEITVTKSTDHLYMPGQKERADQRFDQVRINVERPSDQELAISTKLPSRTSLFTSVLPSGSTIVTKPLPPETKRGITAEYRIHLPRNSRLVVHHDNGYVWVSGVTGGMELNSHTGDMIVMLSHPAPGSIDARTRVGTVSSDFLGEARKAFPAGARFSFPGKAPSSRIRLRMGRGNITIIQD